MLIFIQGLSAPGKQDDQLPLFMLCYDQDMDDVRRRHVLKAIQAQNPGLSDYHWDSKCRYLRCDGRDGLEVSIGVASDRVSIRLVLKRNKLDDQERFRDLISERLIEAGVVGVPTLVAARTSNTLTLEREVDWSEDARLNGVVAWVLARWAIFAQIYENETR